MDCAQAREMLDAFLTGELSPAELEELRGHLDSCEECRQELEETKKFTTTMIELLKPLRPRAVFSEKITERLKKTPAFRKFAGWIVLGAAAVVALGASVALLASGRPVAKLGAYSGEIQIFRYASGGWKRARQRPDLFDGEYLFTPPGARATVHLPGATVRIGENSQVQFLTVGVNVVLGNAYIDARTERGTTVRTGGTLIRGMQARFEVELRQDGFVRVSAYEGRLEGKSGTRTFFIKQGWAAEFVPGGLPEKEEELKDGLPPWLDSPTLEDRMRRATELVALLGERDPHSAYEELLDIGGPAVPALAAAAGSPEGASTPHVLRALGALGGARAEPIVREKLLSDDEGVFRAACEALGRIGARRTPNDLMDVLIDAERPAAVRAEAARCLGAARAESATPTLLMSLACGEPLVEVAAAEALVKLGNKAGGFALANMLADEREEVRERAHRALVKGYGADLPPDKAAWTAWLNRR